ncbi:DCC1-like thiol-disulfide oxidoreductase family protein [Haloferula sp. A504]|uniref:DCC1-like thiol-disulfide oxidoreductase family protein n=1 Tax=Haloferula sp. A504 TaxID=3373601 RepID=UPI0031BED932|nr:DCC1-like thiol-disulfide oxidoreductase family protein [Verrucomicrobiaceae bacterium E54]
MKAMSPWQFTLFRIIFGSYLAVHFLHLAPWAGELFGKDGVLPDPSLNPAHGLFPNPLDLPLSGGALTGVLVLLAALSLCFAAGRWRRTAAVVLWFGWTALFHRNNLIANPSVPYVGLLLILTLLVPAGEPWSRGPRNADWAMPKWVFRAAWILMAAGYTFSGITKLPSESWTDGSAMRFLLDNPLARPGWIREALLALPDVVLKLLTWATLAVELLFLPLALWSRSRPWIWLTLVLMHLGIIAVVDFADLSLGMLMLHLFTFDPAWLKPLPSEPILVRFDGDCLMCSSTIRFVADEDRAKLVRFKPLEVEDGEEPDTMLVDAAGRTLDRSDGVLAILSVLGGHWRAMAMAGRLIPRPLRDALYRFIARNRYRWFGKGNACALPSEALRERLLD